MGKARLIFYLAILLLLLFLYYTVIEALYMASPNDSNERGFVADLMAVFIVPVILLLGFVRLWLLKPAKQRKRLFDVPYYVLPVLIIIACFATWVWVAIILSALAGVLIVYEIVKGISKMNPLLFGNEGV
jgi:hypothetical protein